MGGNACPTSGKKEWKHSHEKVMETVRRVQLGRTGIFAKSNGKGVNVYGIEKFTETDDTANPPLPTEYVHSLTGPIGIEYDRGVNLFFHDNQ